MNTTEALKKSLEFEQLKHQNEELKKRLASALDTLLLINEYSPLADETKEDIQEAAETLAKFGGKAPNVSSYKNF